MIEVLIVTGLPDLPLDDEVAARDPSTLARTVLAAALARSGAAGAFRLDLQRLSTMLAVDRVGVVPAQAALRAWVAHL